MTSHLTPAQLDELLHSASPHLEGHLDACPSCRAELTHLRASLQNLNLTLTALTLDPPSFPLAPSASTPLWSRILPHPWTLTSATAILILSLSLGASHFHHPQAAPARPTPTTQSDQEDDAFLKSIDHDLSSSIAPSLKPLSIQPQTR